MSNRKTLKDMTLEELWQLFPIVLTPHQPQWKDWAHEEIMKLSGLLKEYAPIINHIGSTAIPAFRPSRQSTFLLKSRPAPIGNVSVQ